MSEETTSAAATDGARVIRYEDTRRYLWGDDVSCFVVDWYYASSPKIHMAMFSVAPGRYWLHSETHKSYYGADECYYLLQGSLTFHNPETGEVDVVNAGEALHFRKGTWHYGYNFTMEETLILCTFAPVPPDISSAAELAKLVPPLNEVRGGRYELLGNWPWNAEEARQSEKIKVLPPSDWLHLIHGLNPPVRVSVFVSTENLTMGQVTLLPGVTAEPESHPGDTVVFVAEGSASIFLLGSDTWLEMKSRDGGFIPEGMPFRYSNLSDKPATVLFGVAPRYR